VTPVALILIVVIGNAVTGAARRAPAGPIVDKVAKLVALIVHVLVEGLASGRCPAVSAEAIVQTEVVVVGRLVATDAVEAPHLVARELHPLLLQQQVVAFEELGLLRRPLAPLAPPVLAVARIRFAPVPVPVRAATTAATAIVAPSPTTIAAVLIIPITYQEIVLLKLVGAIVLLGRVLVLAVAGRATLLVRGGL